MKEVSEQEVSKIRQVINYDPLTGSFTWRKSTSNHRKIGDSAGSASDNRGYRYVRVLGNDYTAQRVAWIIMNGSVPDGKIQFKDKNPENLKWDNLILARGIKGYDSGTPEGRAAYGKAWRAANPEKYKDKVLRGSFGIGLREYEAMFVAQGGKCAICNCTETAKRNGREISLCVDHDHATGEVRSLLCRGCNQGIGNFKENFVSLSNAIAYLQKHKEKKIVTNVVNFKRA